MAKDPNKKGFFKEFKEFITRGNVIDLAVGVIIGGAFTAIVNSLVANILQPLITWMIGGGGGLDNARTILGEPVYVDSEAATKVVDWTKTNYIDWGAFISAVINFLLVALILFLIIKLINRTHQLGVKAKEKAKAELLAQLKAEEEAKKAEEEAK